MTTAQPSVKLTLGALEFDVQELNVVGHMDHYTPFLEDVPTYLPPLRRTISFTLTGDDLGIMIFGNGYIGQTICFRFALTDTVFEGKLRPRSFFVSDPVDGLHVGKLEADIVSPIVTRPVHPNCRCTNTYVTEEEAKMYNAKPVPETVTGEQIRENKFYVGHKSTFARDWGHATLAKATEHATELVDENGDDQIIVKIVRVVRRKKTPVTIKDIK